MICANPDVMVERGGRMIYCAGAIARAYEALGGKVEYAGKPYAPIYALTFATLEKLKPGSSRQGGLLAIGDGIGTDIAGAAEAGVRSVFVASGVHVQGGLDGKAIEALFPAGRAAADRGHGEARLVNRRPACLTARAGGPIYQRCPTRTRARPRRRCRRRRPR